MVPALFTERRPGRLESGFRPRPGRGIADAIEHTGSVRGPGGTHLNLYEPGTVRRPVDAATARGPLPAAGATETDAWPLFGTVTGAVAEPARGEASGAV